MSNLVIFVEGADDERFYNWYFNKKVQIIQYSKEKKEKIDNYIKGIKNIPNMDYIVTCDIDLISLYDKKKSIQKLFPNCEEEKIIVSIAEIESWYLAGLNEENSKKMKIKYIQDTDSITKEKFNALLPKRISKLNFMIEILRIYDLEEGINRNRTFYYFHKYIKNLAV